MDIGGSDRERQKRTDNRERVEKVDERWWLELCINMGMEQVYTGEEVRFFVGWSTGDSSLGHDKENTF